MAGLCSVALLACVLYALPCSLCFACRSLERRPFVPQARRPTDVMCQAVSRYETAIYCAAVNAPGRACPRMSSLTSLRWLCTTVDPFGKPTVRVCLRPSAFPGPRDGPAALGDVRSAGVKCYATRSARMLV